MIFFMHCRPKEEKIFVAYPGIPVVPSSIKTEHERLLGMIKSITLENKTEDSSAVKLYELMQHHFQEEERYVLPVLGLLNVLTEGGIPENSGEIIKLTDNLKSQITHLNVEHQLVKAYLDEVASSSAYNHAATSELMEAIHAHAKIEEEVLFPAVILAGEYLKMKTSQKPE